MATSYAQWQAGKRKTARVTWLSGDEPVLCREVSDFVRSAVPAEGLDRQVLFAGDGSEAEIWDACSQYPLPGSQARLVVVHSAQFLNSDQRMAELLGVMAELGGVHLLFEALGCREDHPVQAAVQAAPAGQVISCSFAKDRDRAAQDKRAWVCRALGTTDDVAWELLERTRHDLTAAAAVCAKAVACQFTPQEALGLASSFEPPWDFADSLVLGERKAALLALRGMDDADVSRELGLLASRLVLLGTLYRGAQEGVPARRGSGVPQFLERRFRKAASGYSPAVVVERRKLLGVVDGAWRQGAREGVLEALAACW